MPSQKIQPMEEQYEQMSALSNIVRENVLERLAGRLRCFSHLGAATLLLAVDEDHPGSPDRQPDTCKRQLPWVKRNAAKLELPNPSSNHLQPQKPETVNWTNPACRSTGFAWFADHVRTLLSMELEAAVRFEGLKAFSV